MSDVAAMGRRRVLLGMAAGAAVSTGLAAASLAPPPRPRQRAEVGAAVLPDFGAQADSVALAMVTTTDEFYHLVKDPPESSPGGWVLPEKGRYRVRPDRISALVEGLASMRYARPMTRDERKFDRIGLGDPAQGGAGALLEVGDGRGGSFAKLIVGYRDGTTYVRAPDDLQAWAVEGGALPPLQRGALWLDLNVVDVAAADIAEAQVRVGLSAYGLLPSDEQGSAFTLAPPNAGRLAPGFALTLIGSALTRFAPTDVAPAAEIPVDAVSAVHVTQLKSGVLVAVRAFRSNGRAWVTLKAVADAAAGQEAAAFAQALNARADGWAFGLSETDWGAYATPLEALALR